MLPISGLGLWADMAVLVGVAAAAVAAAALAAAAAATAARW